MFNLKKKEKSEKVEKYPQLTKYAVTFTQNDKYNPITRTIEVQATDEVNVRNIVNNEFGSIRSRGKLKGEFSNKIEIKKVKVVKKDN